MVNTSSREPRARRRVLLADDNAAFLEKLSSLLMPDFNIVATATDGKSALELIRHHEPSVAVLDLGMPGFTGLQVARELAKHPNGPAVVICSVQTDQEIVTAALQEGALGYVFKHRLQPDLILALHSVVRGEHFVSSAMSYAGGELPIVGDRIKDPNERMATVQQVLIGRGIGIRWDQGVISIEYPWANQFTLIARRSPASPPEGKNRAG